MKIKIFKNLPLKLASVFTAFILWLLVTAGGTSIVDFSIPLQFRGLPADLAIAGDFVDRIDVRVKASEAIMQQLSASQIDATIYLSELQEGEHFIPMTFDKIRVPFGVEVVKVDPPRITLTIEKKVEKKVPIMPLLIGKAAEGYKQLDVKVDPPLATVVGAASDMKSVEKASTDAILFANRKSSFTVSAKVIVDNPNVTIITPSVALVEVQISEMLEEKSLSELPLVARGTPYVIKVIPDKIEVTLKGDKSLLESLNENNIKIFLDLDNLKPRISYYNIKPVLEFEPAALAEEITIVKTTPENIKVRIYATIK
jgi:YbbR domain-containing protein